MNTLVKNFTTTLPVQILEELNSASKDLKIGKNDILSNAFTIWNKARKQRMVAQSYRTAAQDPEFQAIAEEGLGDYLEQLEKWEK
jgi:hypothetical protein